MLQRERSLALLVDLMDALQPLPEAAREDCQERVVFGGEEPLLEQFDVDDEDAARMPHRDPRASRRGRVGIEQIAIAKGGDRIVHLGGQALPPGRFADADQIRYGPFRIGVVAGGPRDGDDTPGIPDGRELLCGGEHGVVESVRLGQVLVERRQCRLALHEVALGGDIAHRADDDITAGLRIFGAGERRGDPEAVAVFVRDGHGRDGAVRLVHQSGERVGYLPVRFGVAVGGRPPRVGRWIGQAGPAVAEHLGEGRVQLDDGAHVVADEERLL